MSTISIPPILSLLIGHIAAAVPRRARITFTELLIGAAATRGGHVTDAILGAGLSRSWTTYYWLLQRGRWTWLAVWQALLRVLQMLFDPPVWHVVLDDTLVERISARAPGSLIHHNHTAKPNRPRFLRGQGWLCLAAVVEQEGKVGAVPLMLRLVRRGPIAASSRAPASCCACLATGSAGCASCSMPGSCALGWSNRPSPPATRWSAGPPGAPR